MAKLKYIPIFLIALIAGAVAVPITQYFFPQNATVAGVVKLEVYVDDALWLNGTAIDWGLVEPDETVFLNLTVKNIGNVNTKVAFLVPNLPTGWMETWTPANNTVIAPSTSAVADLVLTVPSDATPGTFNWQSWVRGEQT